MTIDLITIFKAGGYAETDLISFVQKLWPQVQIDVSLPQSQKTNRRGLSQVVAILPMMRQWR